jgi:hypothetical protein
MVAIDMSMMPLKKIGNFFCLRVKGPFGLSKDLAPKRCLTFEKSSKSKEIRESMKGEEGNVHHNKYGGCCINQ